MKLPSVLPLLVLLIAGCQSDDEAAPVKARPMVTPEQQAKVDQELAGQKIGALLKGKTSWLREEGYEKGGLDRAPELYLFYFTASW